ncbi:predicted protein [Plenodomus lingam JN3]|uniref:Predicted protein n=1 Tax=Leptosphaeria maculans (strain JN3 / isolate v23.1.3 / race Av1-4-5-6-7-8) TaxID=985895 RepID=E5AES1_LEPMJ|nr:predicted protein [Plenodomus lingam JN3]CBY01710.1 predicted protein [Plenodomus lingam JN3]
MHCAGGLPLGFPLPAHRTPFAILASGMPVCVDGVHWRTHARYSMPMLPV